MSTQEAPTKADFKERRSPTGRVGSWRWLRGLLGRPLKLERRGLQWHIVLGERRQAPAARGARPSTAQVSEELRERLLVQEADHADKVMRHLVFVHDELSRNGWRGVELLPAKVLGKALVQAQMLAGDDAAPVLRYAVERLHQVHVAAQLREERKQSLQNEAARVEVSETTHEDFEEMERSWVGTPPAAIPPRHES